jgi:hypothetical protein
MTILKANTWQNTSGSAIKTPIRYSTITIPASTVTPSADSNYRASESTYTTSNTTSAYSTTYTPVSNSSSVMFMMFVHCDRSGAGNVESVCLFLNNTCYAVGFLYPRNQGDEGFNYYVSTTFTNSSTSPITVDVRVTNGGGWNMQLARGQWGGGQTAAGGLNVIHVFEYQR